MPCHPTAEFAQRRSAGTGSWITRPRQGRGYGTEARAAILDLAFGHLGTAEALTEYIEGNHASERVSRKLGYVPNGQRTAHRDDTGRVAEYQLRLDPPGKTAPGLIPPLSPASGRVSRCSAWPTPGTWQLPDRATSPLRRQRDHRADVQRVHPPPGPGARLAGRPGVASPARMLAPGGHVESNETAAQCGIREALEETGLDVTLVPGPAAPVPAGFPDQLEPAPWLAAECADPDRHTGEPHIHEDHVYVAITANPRPVRQPEHEVRWFTQADIASDPGICEDSRILAAELLALAAPQPAPPFRWLPGQGRATAAGHQADAAAGRGASSTGHDPVLSPRLIVIRGNSDLNKCRETKSSHNCVLADPSGPMPVRNARRPVWCAWTHYLGGPGVRRAAAALPCTVSR